MDQYSTQVQHYCKTDDRHWTFTEYEASDTLIALRSIGCDVEIADLYAKVVFEPPSALN